MFHFEAHVLLDWLGLMVLMYQLRLLSSTEIFVINLFLGNYYLGVLGRKQMIACQYG